MHTLTYENLFSCEKLPVLSAKLLSYNSLLRRGLFPAKGDLTIGDLFIGDLFIGDLLMLPILPLFPLLPLNLDTDLTAF